MPKRRDVTQRNVRSNTSVIKAGCIDLWCESYSLFLDAGDYSLTFLLNSLGFFCETSANFFKYTKIYRSVHVLLLSQYASIGNFLKKSKIKLVRI